MKLGNAVAAVAAVGLSMFASSTARADEGAALKVHNQTGHEVAVFLFQDSHPHLSPEGGIQAAHLKSGESADAHVPNCDFSVVLVDHEDIWHAEYKDCHSTDLTFTKDTGHDKSHAPAAPKGKHEGEDLRIHNQTGHEVSVFLFQDDHPHLSPEGGVQTADLVNGQSADAHVPNCHFAVLLMDHEDIWHAEYKDCHSTDLTFTKDTGHGTKKH
jgi:hypothetical protein